MLRHPGITTVRDTTSGSRYRFCDHDGVTLGPPVSYGLPEVVVNCLYPYSESAGDVAIVVNGHSGSCDAATPWQCAASADVGNGAAGHGLRRAELVFQKGVDGGVRRAAVVHAPDDVAAPRAD